MIYIFVPLKTETTKNALVLLFITFGLAKLNLGWLESNKLSGLLQLPPVAAKSVSYTLALLETILPLFLLFRGRIFISSLTVLIIYNLDGVFVFDFWLGIIKIILLFIFFIYSVESKKLAENRLHFSFERPLPSKIWTPISLFFIAIALFTDFSMKSGHTSPFSFFKRVSYKSCSVIAFTNKDNTFKEVDIPTNTSSNCDPYVVEFHLNKVCEKISSNTEHQFYIEFTDLANKVKRRYYKNYCKDMKIDI